MSIFVFTFILVGCGGQSSECANYIACMEAMEAEGIPSLYDFAEEEYGPDSRCWNDPNPITASSSALSCTMLCTAGIESVRAAEGGTALPEALPEECWGE